MGENNNLVAGFTPDQLRAMLREATEAQKKVQDAFAAGLSKAGSEFLARIIADTDEEKSEKSAWVGHGVRGLTVTVDGIAYTASVTITNTALTDARKPVVTSAKQVAKEQKLSVDDTAALLKQALSLHDAGTLV